MFGHYSLYIVLICLFVIYIFPCCVLFVIKEESSSIFILFYYLLAAQKIGVLLVSPSFELLISGSRAAASPVCVV